MKYPFRFEGPKIGDTVYWACITYENPEDEIGKLEVIASKICGVLDSYDFAARTSQDPPRETWAIFYDIEDFEPHSLRFGDELFLTEEEAWESFKQI
jgi:hypothetical protein